jgi:hypothetical protein
VAVHVPVDQHTAATAAVVQAMQGKQQSSYDDSDCLTVACGSPQNAPRFEEQLSAGMLMNRGGYRLKSRAT